MWTFNSRIRHNLSIKLVICIKLYAQRVFNIVRPFDILAVECDLKRSHIAFDMKKIPSFLPNPATFCQVEFSRMWVEFGRIRLFRIYVEYGRIPANSMWDPSLRVRFHIELAWIRLYSNDMIMSFLSRIQTFRKSHNRLLCRLGNSNSTFLMGQKWKVTFAKWKVACTTKGLSTFWEAPFCAFDKIQGNSTFAIW